MAHPAIDLDHKTQAALKSYLRKLTDLVQRVRDKLLTTEARIDTHHQHVIGDVQNIFENADRGGRIDDYAGFGAETLDQPQCSIEMARSFIMHRNLVGAGL